MFYYQKSPISSHFSTETISINILLTGGAMSLMLPYLTSWAADGIFMVANCDLET